MGSRKYQITLWVTMEEELAIMNVFHDKGWTYVKFQNKEDIGLFTCPENTVEVASSPTAGTTPILESRTANSESPGCTTSQTDHSCMTSQTDHSSYHVNLDRGDDSPDHHSHRRSKADQHGHEILHEEIDSTNNDDGIGVPTLAAEGKVTYLVEDRGTAKGIGSMQGGYYSVQGHEVVYEEICQDDHEVVHEEMCPDDHEVVHEEVISSETTYEVDDFTSKGNHEQDRLVSGDVTDNQVILTESGPNIVDRGPVYLAVKNGIGQNVPTGDIGVKDFPNDRDTTGEIKGGVLADGDSVCKLVVDLKSYQSNQLNTFFIKGKSLLTGDPAPNFVNVIVEDQQKTIHDINTVVTAGKGKQVTKKTSPRHKTQTKPKYSEASGSDHYTMIIELEKVDKMSLSISSEIDGIKRNRCCMCNKEFNDSSLFEAHADACLKDLFLKVDSRLYKCRNCQAGFRQVSSLLRHRLSQVCEPGMMQRTGEFLTCRYCEKLFTRSRLTEYTIHLLKHRKERAHVCDLCGKSFLRANTLRDHKRKHSGERPFICRFCPVGFTSAAGRANHEKTNHLPIPKRCVCDKCGASFKFSKGLYSHIKDVHDAEYIYKCDKCNTSFKQKGTLNRHMKRHTNEKDKICSFCGKAFFLLTDLNLHVKRHKNERSLFCKECGKGFYTRQTLDNHIKTHTGEKPYECEVCSYKCISGGNLRKHMRNRHTKDGLSTKR